MSAALVMTASALAQSGGTEPPPGSEPPPPTTSPTGYEQVFPIATTVAHSYGGAAARFGVGRGKRTHQGHDLFARCGSPLIAVGRTRVIARGFQRAAGNYVILRSKKFKQDYAYYHMASPAPVAKKALLLPGQFVGYVGQTGNARGCHLHFELWVGKWYRGGRPINPIGALRNWDAYS